MGLQLNPTKSMSKQVVGLALLLVATVSALPVTVNSFSNETAPCALNWFYCPRDPNCDAYTMSVTSVSVDLHGTKLAGGTRIILNVDGTTTLTKLPEHGSYKVYDMPGHNIAGGALADVLTLSAGTFKARVPITLDAASVQGDMVDWGFDIFQDGSGSSEGMCIGVASDSYVKQQVISSEGMVSYCEDKGDGKFEKKVTPSKAVVKSAALEYPFGATPANCGHTKPCDLNWFYCPRDNDCDRYTMSVTSVEVDVYGKTITAGANVTLIVDGTTTLTKLPEHGSYKVYDMPGHNIAGGALADVLKLDGAGKFVATVPITLDAASAAGNVIDWGFDIFQDSSGSSEGMCIGVASDSYVQLAKASSEGMVSYREDKGDGKFVKKTFQDATHATTCKIGM